MADTASRGERGSRSLPEGGRHRRQGGARRRAARDPSAAPLATTPEAGPTGSNILPGQTNGNARATNIDASDNRAGGNRRRFRRRGDGRGHTASRSEGLNHDGVTTLRRGAAGYAFGGHLTEQNENSMNGLNGDAPEFVPGNPVLHRAKSNTEDSVLASITRKDSVLRSTAPDIATRTHQDIQNGLYECSICTNEILHNSKIWSCTLCWTVFHLGCIKKWSKNEGSTMVPSGPRDEDDPAPRRWRCPGCNLPKDALPSIYACWCGKEIEPRSISGVPPHSCGQSCAKLRSLPKECPHPCELTCHAGPCPPCAHMGPVQSCFCGKDAFARRCVETNYVNGRSCGKICGDFMPCGVHTCTRPCHEGLCGACEVQVEASCYCGKEHRTMQCTDQSSPRKSIKFHVEGDSIQSMQEWEGVFDCAQLCERPFDCGKHVCEKTCHPQEPIDPHCPRSPDIVTHCPCGKTTLELILDVRRETCEDPIPNCDQPCLKILSCGHACTKTCHPGFCPPCTQAIHVACRCGRVVNKLKCQQQTNETPTCSRSCRSTLNCGRHECGELCCPGEKKAHERLAQRKKPRSLDALPHIFDNNFEAEHICTRICGKQLKCGNHTCPELCHKGPCKPCREAVFEEISCHCGKTVLQPPLPCGTGAPACRFPCERLKLCGHPPVQHNCHSSQEPCPNCPYLMEKICLCKRKTLKNQPCFRTEVVCGEICGKKLRCGSHFCRKPCHRDGECEDAHSRCQQLCGDPKLACGHPCDDRCHIPAACKEDKPCQSKIVITCDCQHLRTETRCLTSRSSEGNRIKKLQCDDECGRLERNRKLALALNVDLDHQDDHVPYTAKTLELYQAEPLWAQTQERELRLFAADDAEQRMRFKPMPSHRRAFLHALSDDFGFESESLDPEPHRHVFLFKTPRFVKAPMKTLAECVRIRTLAIPGSGMVTSAVKTEQARLTTSNEPFNGILLAAPRFALTIDELRAETSSALASVSTLAFDIEFLPSEEIVFRARPSNSNTTISSAALESLLKGLKPAVLAVVGSKKLAESVSLCSLDSSSNILRRETTEASLSSGWNRVAARGNSPKRPLPPTLASVGQRSSFLVLSKKKDTEVKPGLSKVEVIDDWEEEMRKEEEQGTNSADGHAVSNSEEVASDLNNQSQDQIGSMVSVSEPKDTTDGLQSDPDVPV